MKTLKETMAEKLSAHQKRLTEVIKNSGTKVVDQVTIEQIYSGSRGIHSLLCDTSSVPADKGLIVRGRPIRELTNLIPEEMLFLLLTGDIPERAAVSDIKQEFVKRSEVPTYVWTILDAMPSDSHPMCMLNTAILCMQRESDFAKRYAQGLPKDHYWEATLEDALTLLARLPAIAAYVYRKRFNKGPRIPSDPTLDWSGNYVRMLGLPDPDGNFAALMRLFLVLHSDHESGNVSAMTAGTVNSALSDLYYSLSAGLNGLAGPLHGLANQECLSWVLETMEHYKGVPTIEQISKDAEDTINNKRVIPGYGHAVLRVADPRFEAFMDFGRKNCQSDPVFQTVSRVFEAVPPVLKKFPKIKNPWPNVDAASGALLYHYGLKEKTYYTVLFSVSRALGICSQAIVARGLGQPIVRPTSVTTEWLESKAKS